ncbi:hypothetical protein A2866_02295 [Candidatus Roizmanbacteria bacterium RIFCSPHIGHO2_01_FULL_39_8]|uniref:Phosphoribosyltransferase domain-containing protein n=3 Tax=Candidatus Roizmaniibacteriota TaxID=1752723 RepID=A0A1F7GH09_9BACT|nr:MAG: hypothetical protein A2866_02295 [Candidatus Roizmanbacteria bacterium RIFCSPHIGHO2_01_FULL_39_8]OGK27586.1 MAG: hypothetical protein A3C28_06165 [Candidatus Roizmanbacteria bacterium RIFCSPHIGHO2_02_FULL_39_9]OGK37535.1 MAG: hypothetical protein A3F60_00190 [Candidatus Roizmanbacteria bacterium RIFCSPHIGHO2_12_FULL_39_8]
MERLSWEEVEETADKLAEKIKESQFKPDYIIGVTTGGLYPLAMLAQRLEIKNILTITAKKSKKDKREIVTINYFPDINLKDKKILLVDEIAQSGITLHTISEMILDRYKPSVLKTATLAANGDVCKLWPDYYLLIEKGDWIKFPWEKEEFSPYDLIE